VPDFWGKTEKSLFFHSSHSPNHFTHDEKFSDLIIYIYAVEKLLSVKELSERLGVHESTIYRRCARGLLSYVKIGRSIRFRPKDIEDWLEQGGRKAVLLTKFISPHIYSSGGVEMPRGKSRTRLSSAYGSVYQRKTKTGHWTIDYYDASGKRIQRVAKCAQTRQEAMIALHNAVRKEFFKSQGIKEEKRPVCFEELADLYVENYAKLNKESWKDDMYRIEAHMKPFFGDLELHNVTPLLIEKYRAKRLKKGVSKSTVNREASIMKKMFNLAIDWNVAEENPVQKVKLFSEKDTMKERILTEKEEAVLLARSSCYLKSILITALNTGMRRGEILNLKWSQVNMEKRCLRVEQTKSGKNRMIPINGYLYRELLKVKSLNGKSEYVFPNPKTGRPFTEVKKSFKNACKRAGIHDLRFHDLRHTFATRLIESGVDLITVRDLLGHFSVRVTQRYTHSNQNQKKEAVELLVRRVRKEAKN